MQTSSEQYSHKDYVIRRSNPIIRSLLQLYKSPPCLSLSHANLSECEVCINEGGHLPIYTNQVTDLLHDWGQPLTLTQLTSPRETPKIHYMMLHWGLLPRLTTEFVPQGIYTIMTSRKEENTYTMGVQQHTLIIYIRIPSKVTNTSTVCIYWATKPTTKEIVGWV